MPDLRRQCRASSAPRPGLQSGELHADTGDAEDGGPMVADQPAREAGQDRREGRQPWALHHLPARRGRSAATDVRRHPGADRPAARTARTCMTGVRVRCCKETMVEVRPDGGKAPHSRRSGPVHRLLRPLAEHPRPDLPLLKPPGGSILSRNQPESGGCRGITLAEAYAEAGGRIACSFCSCRSTRLGATLLGATFPEKPRRTLHQGLA